MATEIQVWNEVKYESGEIIRTWKQAELSFLHATFWIDLFYYSTKYS